MIGMVDFDKRLLEKYNCRRRLVEECDAEFITLLRSDKELAKHIHFNDGDVQKQIEWTRKYKEREKQGKEYYYIYESIDGERYGTTRLSDFDDHSCVIGSWLFRPDAPLGLSVLCETAGKQAAFDHPKIKYIRFDVRKLNKQVVRYHQRMWNSLKITEDELNNYYVLTRETYENSLEEVLELCNLM